MRGRTDPAYSIHWARGGRIFGRAQHSRSEVPAGSLGADKHLVVLPVFGKALFAGELKGFGEVFALAGGVVCVQRQDHLVIFYVENRSGAFILL